MRRLWKFIQKDKNRQIVSWLGGGVVVVVAGLWAATVFFLSSRTASVEARCGAVAIGGSVTGSTISGAGNAACPKSVP